MIFSLFLVGLLVCATVNAGEKSESTKETAEANLNLKQLKTNIDNAEASLANNLGKLLSKDTKEKNYLFSPLNFFNALAMLHLGAEGETRDELADFLGFSKDAELSSTSHEYFSKILKSVQHSSAATVNLAAGVFVQKDVKLNEQYLVTEKKYYDSEIMNVDFSSESANDIINNWVSNKTNGRIPQLYPNPIASNTKIALSAALYFSSTWYNPFLHSETQSEKFHTGTATVDAFMMINEKVVPYTDNPTFKIRVIGLNYSKKEFSLFILLPYEDQTLANVIQNLQPENIRQIVGSAQSNQTNVEYKIPRVKFSWTQSFNLELQTLGLKKLFNSAQLTKMTSEPLSISTVQLAAEIEINESGTNASAAMSIALTKSGLVLASGPPIKFYVNQPFAFIIYHHETKSIIFVGQVYNPNE